MDDRKHRRTVLATVALRNGGNRKEIRNYAERNFLPPAKKSSGFGGMCERYLFDGMEPYAKRPPELSRRLPIENRKEPIHKPFPKKSCRKAWRLRKCCRPHRRACGMYSRKEKANVETSFENGRLKEALNRFLTSLDEEKTCGLPAPLFLFRRNSRYRKANGLERVKGQNNSFQASCRASHIA